MQEKKRILRLMIKDVTLVKDAVTTLKIRWQGGAQTIMEVPIRLPAPSKRITPEKTIERIRQLSKSLTSKQMVDILNQEGYTTGVNNKFDASRLQQLMKAHSIKSYYWRLRKAGKLTVPEMAKRLGICTDTVKKWYQAGLLTGYVANDKGEYLFDPPTAHRPVKRRGEKLETRREKMKFMANPMDWV